jgi:hypothetical protein
MTGGGGKGEKDGARGGATPARPRSSISGKALSEGPPTGHGRHARARGAKQRRRWVERMQKGLDDARRRHVLALASTASPPERGSGESTARRIGGATLRVNGTMGNGYLEDFFFFN